MCPYIVSQVTYKISISVTFLSKTKSLSDHTNVHNINVKVIMSILFLNVRFLRNSLMHVLCLLGGTPDVTTLDKWAELIKVQRLEAVCCLN